MTQRRGRILRWALVGGGLYAAFLVVLYLLVPRIIEAAYAGRAWDMLNGLISGQDQHDLQTYLAYWARMAHTAAATGGVVLLALFAVARYGDPSWARLKKWRPFSDDPPIRPPFRELPLFALSIGLLTGGIELAAVWVRQTWLGEPQWYYGPTAVWMTPLAHAVLFVLLSVAAIAASRMSPGYLKLRVVAGGLVTVAAYVVVEILFTNLHSGAAWLLGAGLASRTAGPIVRHWRRVTRWSAAATAMLTVAILFGTIGIVVKGRIADSRVNNGATQVSADSPNIILIVWDTVRAMSLSAYGYEEPTTPYLESMAQSGVVFTRALSPSSWTLASHASMFTGRDAHELSVDWKIPLDSEYPTLAEVLRERGYATGGFSANPYYGTEFFGLSRGFAHYEAMPRTLMGVVQSAWPTRRLAQWARSAFSYRRGLFRAGAPGRMLVRKDAQRINRSFLDWADRTDRPFFAFLNLYDAHDPYEPPDEFARFGPDRTRRDPWIAPAGYSPAELVEERAAYHGAITYLDHALGELIGQLEDRGVLGNTLIIVTSDHGEEFAEHPSVMGHGGSLYLPSVHVPLVIRWDGAVPAGSVVNVPTSLRDLAPTILDLLGVREPGFPDASLARLWRDTPTDSGATVPLSTVRYREMPDAYPLSRGDLASVSVGDYYYVLNGDGSEELFDWRTDPLGIHDLAGSEEAAAVLDRARKTTCGHLDVGGCAR